MSSLTRQFVGKGRSSKLVQRLSESGLGISFGTIWRSRPPVNVQELGRIHIGFLQMNGSRPEWCLPSPRAFERYRRFQ
jgi:hypothetical protein